MNRALGMVVLLLLAGCATPGRHKVVAVARTNSYHTDRCPKVAMARTVPMTLEEARALRLNACPSCLPEKGSAL